VRSIAGIVDRLPEHLPAAVLFFYIIRLKYCRQYKNAFATIWGVLAPKRGCPGFFAPSTCSKKLWESGRFPASQLLAEAGNQLLKPIFRAGLSAISAFILDKVFIPDC
jgi:hypothetical protein